MTKRTYFIPIKVKINAENPEAIVKMIGDTIYDALTEKFNKERFSEQDSPVRKITVDFSFYQKLDNQEEEVKQE